VLFAISVQDIRSHRIPNFSLLILCIAAFLEGERVGSLTFVLLSLSGVLAFTFLSRCGFGDAKLILVIVNLLIKQQDLSDYVIAVALISSIHIVVHYLYARKERSLIPFAPALCGAVLAVSLNP
jgi:Flp pilus assembly protein protease CpaA